MSHWAYADAYNDGQNHRKAQRISFDYYGDNIKSPYADVYDTISGDVQTLLVNDSQKGNYGWKSSSSRRSSPLSSTPEYLETSLINSTRLESPLSARKLLILDLNGTLLIRSAHSRVIRDRGEWKPDSGQPPPSRPLRAIHPRPYLSSFASYIFHSQTKDWLDTMVWSSAQPHSVCDMVTQCFGKLEDGKHPELVAIWARDTLGLDKHSYHNKTQTTKDLAKPWAELPNTSSPSSNQPIRHSALSTLLLDDSPKKAHLQPYNHLCVREYTQPMRVSDIRCFESQRMRARDEQLISLANITTSIPNTPPSSDNPQTEDPLLSTDEVDKSGRRKRKRVEKKQNKKLQNARDRLASSTVRFDETLLAVIGILDCLKHESNVSNWLRAGGLFDRTGGVANEEADPNKADLPKELEDTEPECSDAESNLSVERPSDQQKRTRLSSPITVHSGKDDCCAPEMWFDDLNTVHRWAQRGRSALEALGLEVVVGIDG